MRRSVNRGKDASAMLLCGFLSLKARGSSAESRERASEQASTEIDNEIKIGSTNQNDFSVPSTRE